MSLVPDRLQLLVSGAGSLQSISLAGRTLEQARRWLGQALGLEEPPPPPCHDLPDSPVAAGAPFDEPGEAGSALVACFGDAAFALEALRRRRPQAGPVRCWPHHFDMAVLEPLASGPGGGSRSVGAGMTPGDAVFALPYFYVLPWPRPAGGALPPLPEGAWYTGSWTGAVLTAGDLADADAGEQQARIERFLDAATAAARTLLGADAP